MATLRTVLASVTALLALFCASASAASPVAPLPESDYAVRPACAAPAPGSAGCLALRLVPQTAAARARTHPLGVTRPAALKSSTAAEGADGLRPQDLRSAYFPGPGEQPEAPASTPQTIALVDVYNDPSAESDLNTYSQEFDLPALATCTSGQTSDCFEQVNQNGATGEPPFPVSEAEREEKKTVCLTTSRHETKEQQEEREAVCGEVVEADGWAIEISTDIETAHAICHNCRILLVEASSAQYPDLEAAEQTAVNLGATEVSNSWGGAEPEADSAAFNHPDTVITAAAGDFGYLNWTEVEVVEAARKECFEEASLSEECEEIGYSSDADYPASSPHVVAVGGTKLLMSSSGARESESVWNEDPSPEGDEGAGGSGCSERFSAPPWQTGVPDWTGVGCGSKRAVADIAADADPYTGVAVDDSVPDLRVEENEAGKDEIVNTPPEWWPIGGTSVASPIIASMYALAGGAHGVEYPAKTLYGNLETNLLHPVTDGGNGKCDDIYTAGCSGSMSPLSPLDCGAGVLICNAAPGCAGHYYDGPTGVGTPNGIGAFKPEEHAAKDARECEKPNTGSGDGSSSGGNEPGPGDGNGGGEPSPGTGTGTTQPESSTSGNTSSSGTTTGSPAPSARALVPILSAPALKRTAVTALTHATRPKLSQIAFAFTLNTPAHVRITLAKLVVEHGRRRWQTLPESLTIVGARGRDSAHLSSHGTLAPGDYRLTLTPAGGAAHTLAFQVG